MNDIKRIIAENLRNVVALRGIKQKDIAAHLGVKQGSVANWLNGVNGMDMERLYQICTFLGVSLDQIVGIDPVYDSVSDREIRLINVFRVLNETGKQRVETYADDMSKVYAREETIDEADERMLRTAEKIAAEAEDDDSVTTA